uniref:Uncharacterized protein n=1 Tax=Pseudomonas phage HRDY3 TaxID=3236930 RepID=A0AB39CE08_9VIRU
MWDSFSPEEQLDALNKLAHTSEPHINFDLLDLLEKGLNNPQRMQYADYVSGAISDLTYRQHDPSHPDTALHWYFNMVCCPFAVRAKMLWCTITGNQP